MKKFWNGVNNVFSYIIKALTVGVWVLIGFFIGLVTVVLVYFFRMLPYIIVIGLILLIVVKCIV